MGTNFEQTVKGKVGDIIYPAYNNTSRFWKKPRWDLVTRVDKEGNIMDVSYMDDFATVRAIEILKKFTDLKWVVK